MSVQFGDARLPERLWSKVRMDPSGCWIWTAGLKSSGYGHAYVGGGRGKKRMAPAHRLFYSVLIESPEAGLVMDHLCRVRTCVNPTHLEPVTRGENVLRGETLSAANARKTHCPRGHAYSGDNLCVTRWGRRCKACDRLRCEARKSFPVVEPPTYRPAA